MKRFLLLLAFAFIVVCCAPRVPVTGLSYLLSNDSVIEVGDFRNFHIIVEPSNATEDIETSSSNTAVAYVDGDKVVAVSPGEATITAKCTYSGLSISFQVKVIPKRVAIQSVSFDTSEINVRMGDSVAVNIVVQPKEAIRDEIEVEWTIRDGGHYFVENGEVLLDWRWANVHGNGFKAFVLGQRFGPSKLEAKVIDRGFKTSYTIECPINVQCKIPDPVDLGLSVFWGSFDVGRSSPEDWGGIGLAENSLPDGIFSWGVVNFNKEIRKDLYPYLTVTGDGWTTPIEYHYTYLGENISKTEYDVANVQLGNGWRMPTKEEFLELIDRCIWERTFVNDMMAFKVVGPNGNHIYLLAYDQEAYYVFGGYWCGDAGESEESAYYLRTGDNSNPEHTGDPSLNEASVRECSRWWGLSVRPVKDK